jgi:hypothetical protein
MAIATQTTAAIHERQRVILATFHICHSERSEEFAVSFSVISVSLLPLCKSFSRFSSHTTIAIILVQSCPPPKHHPSAPPANLGRHAHPQPAGAPAPPAASSSSKSPPFPNSPGLSTPSAPVLAASLRSTTKKSLILASPIGTPAKTSSKTAAASKVP